MRIIAVSDIHGYYDILKEKLKLVNFKENSNEDLLVCCGDYWDRGKQPYEIMTYLMSLSNVVLVKGNHEYLMEDYLRRNADPMDHDLHNGTDRTFWLLSNHIKLKKGTSIVTEIDKLTKKFYDKMVDYYETEHYVFVHGWIPCKHKGFRDKYPIYDPNWRNGDWSDSCWLNGIDMAEAGVLVPGKTVVCGHWHCSYGWSNEYWKKHHMYVSAFGDDAKWDIYENDGILAIDRCTAHTKDMNILVLEDDLLE